MIILTFHVSFLKVIVLKIPFIKVIMKKKLKPLTLNNMFRSAVFGGPAGGRG